MISGNQALLRCCVSHNAIALNGVIAISKALPNTRSLCHLDISHNQVAELALIEMLNGLRTNTSLQVLDMSGASGGASENLMREVAAVTAERLSKLPANTPQTSVLLGAPNALPAHLTTPDAPIVLQKLPPAAQGRGGKGTVRAGSSKPKPVAPSPAAKAKTPARK